MIVLRSPLFHALQLVTVVPYALLCLLWAPLQRQWRYRLTLGWPRLVIHAARMIIMPRELCYVFKRELLWLPFFGWGIGLLDMIHIDRRRGGLAFEQLAQEGAIRLAQGRWIILFPEGTRTRAGTRTRYKTGGARLAVRAGVPVIPVAVNSGEVESWIENEMRRISPHLHAGRPSALPTEPLRP